MLTFSSPTGSQNPTSIRTVTMFHSNDSSSSLTAECIDRPGPSDIVCTKDKSFNNHEGNRLFREVIFEYQETYAKATNKPDKMQITKEIVKKLQTNYNARFIKYVSEGTDGSTWQEISNLAARDKVSHALRFASRSLSTSPRTSPLLNAAEASSQIDNSDSRSFQLGKRRSSSTTNMSNASKRRSNAAQAAFDALVAFDSIAFFEGNKDDSTCTSCSHLSSSASVGFWDESCNNASLSLVQRRQGSRFEQRQVITSGADKQNQKLNFDENFSNDLARIFEYGESTIPMGNAGQKGFPPSPLHLRTEEEIDALMKEPVIPEVLEFSPSEDVDTLGFTFVPLSVRESLLESGFGTLDSKIAPSTEHGAEYRRTPPKDRCK